MSTAWSTEATGSFSASAGELQARSSFAVIAGSCLNTCTASSLPASGSPRRLTSFSAAAETGGNSLTLAIISWAFIGAVEVIGSGGRMAGAIDSK